MNITWPCNSHSPLYQASTRLLATVAILTAVFASGCGTSGNNGGPPPLSGNAAVTVMLSSAANDQLSEFSLDFVSIALTNKAGKTVTLPSPQLAPDFIHSNGTVEPWLTATVPQDVYTTAVVTIGNSWFNCETIIHRTALPSPTSPIRVYLLR